MSVWRSLRNFPRLAPIIAAAGGKFLFSFHSTVCDITISRLLAYTLSPPTVCTHMARPPVCTPSVCRTYVCMCPSYVIMCVTHGRTCRVRMPMGVASPPLTFTSRHYTVTSLHRHVCVRANVTAIYSAGDFGVTINEL